MQIPLVRRVRATIDDASAERKWPWLALVGLCLSVLCASSATAAPGAVITGIDSGTGPSKTIAAAAVPTTDVPSTVPVAAVATTTVVSVPPTTSAPPSTTVPPTSSTTTTVPTSMAVAPSFIGSAQQVMSVVASYGDTYGTFNAYQTNADGSWAHVFGPWRVELGYNGVAPPGAKHEGDGRTPSGSFGFGFDFGVNPDPGVQVPYRQITSHSVVWDDDPDSADYNEWVDESLQGVGAAGANPEPMYNTPAYDYGSVIDYNTDPVVKGAGSAIFLHVSTGGPTAGCVALPISQLLAVLRWMQPVLGPRIVIGTASTVAQG